MVVPYRHVDSLGALSVEELHELALLTQRSEAALLEAYQPQGINVGINLGRAAGAGILEHIHVHLVPRWNGDTNFMTVIGETRVLPEDLESTARKLRPIFQKLSSPLTGHRGTGTEAPALLCVSEPLWLGAALRRALRPRRPC